MVSALIFSSSFLVENKRAGGTIIHQHKIRHRGENFKMIHRIHLALVLSVLTSGADGFTVPSLRTNSVHSIGRIFRQQHSAESKPYTMADSNGVDTNGDSSNGFSRYSDLLSEVGMENANLKSLEDLPAKRPVSVDDVFCNRELNLGTIRAIGFDMDYTLAQYKQPAFDKLAFDGAKEKLVKVLGYPEELLDAEYDHKVSWKLEALNSDSSPIVANDALRIYTRIGSVVSSSILNAGIFLKLTNINMSKLLIMVSLLCHPEQEKQFILATLIKFHLLEKNISSIWTHCSNLLMHNFLLPLLK